MNNSKIAIENVSLELEEDADISPSLRKRLAELVEEIEALENIHASRYWKTLNEKIFTPELNRLLTELVREKGTIEVFRLQGAIEWIKKNLDLNKLASIKRNESTQIRQQLKKYEQPT